MADKPQPVEAQGGVGDMKPVTITITPKENSNA